MQTIAFIQIRHFEQHAIVQLLIYFLAFSVILISGCAPVPQKPQSTQQPEKSWLSQNSRPGCWILLEKCKGDLPDYQYYSGAGISNRNGNRIIAQRNARKAALIKSISGFTSYLNTSIEGIIEETNICKGKADSGMQCRSQIKSKIFNVTKGTLRGNDYEVDDEYFDKKEYTYYIRIKIRQKIAERYLTRVRQNIGLE